MVEQLKASDKPEAKKQLQELEDILDKFEISSLENGGALTLVLQAKDFINKISV